MRTMSVRDQPNLRRGGWGGGLKEAGKLGYRIMFWVGAENNE